ncbi:hypothetical protein [Psychromonas hadalis]|uniref:hypothetical protein n=1 Tax=Psychromonas hadalis TaxID=211669 RepID=UPI0003B4AC22|nr:hypothetical protein [Psychromonas hadalis]
MESKFTRTIIFIATITATIFAGIQTFSYSGLLSLKQIQYEIVNVSSSKQLKGEISDIFVAIQEGDKRINLNAPVFVDILIQNTGNVDIPKLDFDGNIEFTFTDSKPLRVQQISSSTDSLDSSPQISDNIVRIKPLLLNSGDYFMIQVLFDGAPTELNPHLRFLGMDSDFNEIPEKSKFTKIDYASVFMVFIAFVIMGRLASIILFNVELHRWDLMMSMFTVYVLGLVLASQITHLFNIGIYIEIITFFVIAVGSGVCSWYLSNKDDE